MLKHLLSEAGVLFSAQHKQVTSRLDSVKCGVKGLTLFDDVWVAAVQLLLGGQSDVVAQEVAELHQHVGRELVGSFVLLLHVVWVGRFVVERSADHPGTRQSGLISSSTAGL